MVNWLKALDVILQLCFGVEDHKEDRSHLCSCTTNNVCMRFCSWRLNHMISHQDAWLSIRCGPDVMTTPIFGPRIMMVNSKQILRPLGIPTQTFATSVTLNAGFAVSECAKDESISKLGGGSIYRYHFKNMSGSMLPPQAPLMAWTRCPPWCKGTNGRYQYETTQFLLGSPTRHATCACNTLTSSSQAFPAKPQACLACSITKASKIRPADVGRYEIYKLRILPGY